MDLADSDSLSRVESYSGTGSSAFPFGVRDYHTLWSFFPEQFCLGTGVLNTGPTTPRGRVPEVWAIPLSLAATDGVAFAFFSWG